MYNAIEMMRLAKGRFSLLWRLAIDKGRKSIRKELMEADIEKYCSDILEAVAFSGEDVNLRFSLHLLSTLCTGIVQLHLKRTELLLHDVEKLNALLSSKLKEDKQRGDDNAEQLGISDVLSEVGRKGKRKDALTLLNIDASLIDLSNDLDKMAADGELKFGAVVNMSDITLQEAHPIDRDGDLRGGYARLSC